MRSWCEVAEGDARERRSQVAHAEFTHRERQDHAGGPASRGARNVRASRSDAHGVLERAARDLAARWRVRSDEARGRRQRAGAGASRPAGARPVAVPARRPADRIR